ncbi:hypothetical protein Acsp03_62460 [Actinomadura sp. NBRC 104412]|uniref:DUF3566 domain-containing protein n=1 Tax=Actinomadura sp. NBRC 104412 TaxID=3032203 RepID=UPI0024A53FBE|nr:DUF3566 domain-containing protein [Actinomadura sp. NBRC 104412]GLZ08780.1 hypothetical protein Acsp03_62460 [Actinomadura sp. NBRC 104412]
MSTQPGKDEARSPAGRTGQAPASASEPAPGSQPGPATGPDLPTVAGSSSGPGPGGTAGTSAATSERDGTTVEISEADETKADLPKIDANADKPVVSSAAAPMPSAASSTGSASGIPPVKDTPSAPSSDPSAGRQSWTPPSPLASSASTDGAGAKGAPTQPRPDAHSSGPGGYGSGNSGPGIQGAMNATPAGPDPAGGNHGNPGAQTGQAPGTAAPQQASSGPGGGQSRFGKGGFSGTLLKNRTAKPASTATPTGGGKTARKAQLQLARLEPWSVMKFSFVMSLVCFVVLLVAVIVLYVILSWLGVFSAITDTVSELTRRQGETTGGLDAGSWFSFARVFGYTVLVGALNVLLITALSTVASVIYNLAADLVGGVEVTLKEAE